MNREDFEPTLRRHEKWLAEHEAAIRNIDALLEGNAKLMRQVIMEGNRLDKRLRQVIVEGNRRLRSLDERLNILIDVVEKYISGRDGRKQGKS